MSDRNYPVAVEKVDGIENDPRFTIGLLLDIEELLVKRGYPKFKSLDHTELLHAMFMFLYRSEKPWVR